jgi:hypothetical protein
MICFCGKRTKASAKRPDNTGPFAQAMCADCWKIAIADGVRAGIRVRFNRDNMGASEQDDLTRYVSGNNYGPADVGVAAFPHPNQRGNKYTRNSGNNCAGWWYYEVESKTEPGRKLYVGAARSMVEVLP